MKRIFLLAGGVVALLVTSCDVTRSSYTQEQRTREGYYSPDDKVKAESELPQGNTSSNAMLDTSAAGSQMNPANQTGQCYIHDNSTIATQPSAEAEQPEELNKDTGGTVQQGLEQSQNATMSGEQNTRNDTHENHEVRDEVRTLEMDRQRPSQRERNTDNARFYNNSVGNSVNPKQ